MPPNLRRPTPVLRDRRLDRALRRDGYVVTRLIAADAAHCMREQFGQIHGWSRHQLIDDQPPDFEIAMWDADPDYQRRIAELVDGRTLDPIESMFATHRSIARSVMIKWPTEGDAPKWDGVPDSFHSDATYVDERTGARGFRIWLALEDVADRNGGVHIVPHSHRLDRDIRGWGVESPWMAHAEVFDRHAISVDLHPGEALIFDPALIHRSGPNTTDEPRVAVSILLTDPHDPLCLFRRRDESTAEKVAIDADFFSNGHFNDMADLGGGEVVQLDMAPRSERYIDRQLTFLSATGRWSSAARRGRAG